MQDFRSFLQAEFLRRSERNPAYSLRAYARQLGVNHATLSTFLSGKRRLTAKAIAKLGQSLELSPEQIIAFTSTSGETKTPRSKPYFVLQEDAFNSMSAWYFDAILELCKIPKIQLNPDIISSLLGIPALQARLALETLERLELIKRDKAGRYRLQHADSTNILDPDTTTAAQKKYQRSILEKSLDALTAVEIKNRVHNSTTIAMNYQDLAKTKQMIQKFSRELTAFLQRDGIRPNDVYQLQVSFFPLIKNKSAKELE